MNRIYRVIWSTVRNAWVVASELATGQGKSHSGAQRPSTRDHRFSPRISPLRLAVLAALFGLQVPSHAADRYWDTNRTLPGLGGAGIWDLTTTFWGAADDGVTGPYAAWSNAALDDAYFSGTGGAISVNTPITAHSLFFTANGYSLTGSTLTLAGVNPTITTNPGVTTTIASAIAGTAGLTKNGTGVLVLTGNNTFSGGLTVNAGSLSVAGNAALGALSNGVTMAAGTALNSTTTLSGRTVALTGGLVTLQGAAGSARFTGAGGLDVTGAGVSLTDDTNDYTGQTRFRTNGSRSFTSIADLGIASSLGAPTDVALGTVVFQAQSNYSDSLRYLGDGDSSNRNWEIASGGGGAFPAVATLLNSGSGTLRITGSITGTGGIAPISFSADTADFELLGVIGDTGTRSFSFTGSSTARRITLGRANTYAGDTTLGAATVRAPVLADIGVNSSFGTGSAAGGGRISITGGVLSYSGAAASTNRLWTLNNGTISNDGTGALTLTGAIDLTGTGAIFGGSYTGAANTVSGIIAGTGALASNGAGTWLLTGANTRSGAINVQNGTLRAGNAAAFGTTTGITIDNGTLDLNGYALETTTLAGNGGTLALGNANLTFNAATGVTGSYAGSITGSGGIIKLGASTQTLTGSNQFTGHTSIGGGTLVLDFTASGPLTDILSSQSTLHLSGGNLVVTGGAGENNIQTFDGVNISAGTNNISATAGAGGSITLNLGAVNRSGGLVDFDLPSSGFITTTSAELGGWATVNNGSSYAKVDENGHILAFTDSDYTIQNNPGAWSDGQFISDDSTGFNSPSTIDSPDGTLQLGGLRYTAAKSTTLTIAGGDTLGIDGAILVTPTVGAFNQTITGGSLTGMVGGGTLGIQQNSAGRFFIASQITDNGGAIGFTKSGSGDVVLSNATNDYTGATIVTQGMLEVANIANGGQASSIGASSADSSNLVLEGAELRYTGGSVTTDRGFTINRSGSVANSTIGVTNAGANLEFTGVVTGGDGAGLIKTGGGTLTLSNGANDYTGITSVNTGTLSVTTLANGGAVSSIGASSSDSSNLVLSGGGRLQYTGGSVTSDRGFTLNGISGGVIDVTDVNTTLTLGGTAVGLGSAPLRKEGAGTLVLAGTNTYAGGTTVNGGVLRAGSESAFGGASLMTLADAAGVTLDLAGFANKVGGLSGGGLNGGNVLLGNATLTIGGSNASYSGAISGAGGLYKDNSSAQTMVGCNHSYTGPTTIWAGTLSVNCLADGGAPSGIGASGSGPSNLLLRGTLDYTGGSIAIDRGFQATGGTISVANSGTTLEMSGQVTGTSFWKGGLGTLVLSNGTNAHTAYAGVSGGTLRVAGSGVFGAGGLRFSGADTTVDLDGFDNTVQYIHTDVAGANQRILLDGANLTIAGGGSAVYSGAISGAGNLIKNGGSTQSLSGCTSDYSGSTTINAGWLDVSCLNNGGTASSIGNSSSDPTNLTINAGLQYSGAGSTTDRQFTVGTAGASLSSIGTGAVNFTSTAPIEFTGTNARTVTLRGTNTDNNTLSAQITNAGAGVTRLTKTDGGTWVLGNENNTYTGITRVDGGVLAVTKLADALQASSIGASSGAAANLVIGNNSTLRYTGSTDSSTNRQFTLSQGVSYIESSGVGALKFTNTGNVTLAGAGGRTIALGGTNTGDNTMGGTIADASASGRTTLAKNDSGTWILTGNNTYTGNTVINAGNLMIGNGGNTGNAGAGNVIVDSAASTLSINRSDTFDFNGTLSGPGRLAQVGTGTTRLTSTNSIGATTVSAGTLEVDGTLSSSTFAMNGPSTLNVDGTVQGANGGAATFAGDAGASTINVRAGGTLVASGDLGDGNDALNLTGTLNTTAGVLNLGAGDDTFTLNDGAVINGLGVNAGSAALGDVLLLNNAAALTFNGGTTIGFETLVKQNTGVATMTGTQIFIAGTTINAGTLDVDGTLQTSAVAVNNGTTLNVDGTVQAFIAALSDGATLNVNGIMQAPGGMETEIIGSAGVNTVVVNQGATLYATGDLGDGDDVLDVAGTLNTGGGTFSLGAGNDTFVVHDTTVVIGTLDAGDGDDMLNVNVSAGNVVPLGSTTGFESLGKSGLGWLAINGASDFVDVQVQAGVLDVTSTGSIETHLAGVSAGATLNVDGSFRFTSGGDGFTVAGNVTGSGSINMLDGDDVLTIQDGASINIAIDGGNAVTGDIVALDSATALTFDGTNITGFEQLVKQNVGTATLAGTHQYDTATIEGGTLRVAGTLNANTVELTDGTRLSVDGTVRTGPAVPTTITGSAGVNTVVVNAGGYLLAAGDLGDGSDVLDVSGTLDTGGGTLSLGDGDDFFVIHDGTNVIGTVDGGAGMDTRVYDINLIADVGALSGFEGLTKTGTGVLNINGPGTSFFEQVQALGGTLNVAAAGAVDGVASTTVGSQGTLQVDGTYNGTAGNDTFTVDGRVIGAGTIDLGDGDDLLTIRDGATIDMPIDGGAAYDTVALDSAVAQTFASTAVTGFERLLKQNDGIATLIGAHSYENTTVEGGTLQVDGSLETDTFYVDDGTTVVIDGTVQAAGATQTVITGSAGVDTIIVNQSGNLLATGNLGDGNDVLDVYGTLDTGGGILSLGDGDDSFVIHDGTIVLGTVAGGAGLDTRVYDITGTAQLGALQEFEGLTKRNTGTLNITGPAATTGLQVVAVEGGTLNIGADANVTGVEQASVDSGAILNIDGAFGFTAGADTFTIAGIVTGSGTIDMLDGDDRLTLLDGADLSGLSTAIDGGAGVDTLIIDVSTSATLGGATGFETLIKQGVGSGTIAGPAGSMFESVLVREGVLEVAAGAVVDPVTTIVDAGATMIVNGTYNGTADADTFTLSGTLAGNGRIDLLEGDDILTMNTGSDVTFTGVFDANAASSDRFVLSGAGDDTFDASLIDTVFLNFDEFRKEGTGTWRLTGSGAQHWSVAEGTLIGDSTSLAGNIDNAATVIFDQATDGSYAGVLSGSGTLIKRNNGTLAMTATHAFTGDTQIQSGTLQIDGVLPGMISVASGGTLSGIGTVSNVTTLTGGFVAAGNPIAPFGTLTIAGNYDGAGTVRINTELGDETSATSRLVIRGNVTGASAVLVNRIGGDGAATTGDGIGIIQVDGVSAADSFRLARPVQAGAYEYLLYQGGASDANDWYLRSELIGGSPVDPEQPPPQAFRPGVAGYVLGHQANLEYGFSALGNLRARVGDQGRAARGDSNKPAADAWMRVYAHELDISGGRFSAEDLRMNTVHFGTDVYSHQNGNASVHIGVMASVGESRTSFFDTARAAAGLATRAGQVEADVAGGGLYWTRHGGNGGYFDVAAQVLHYRNRYQDQYLAASHQSGWGGTLSAEIGKAFALGGNWRLEPQLQLAYQRLELDGFTDQVSAVSAVYEDALRGRAALQLFRAPSRWLGMDDASPYVALGAQRDFRDADSITIGSTTIGEEIPDITGDVSVGFNGSVRPGVELHLDLRYQKSSEGERDGVRGNFGFRMTF